MSASWDTAAFFESSTWAFYEGCLKINGIVFVACNLGMHSLFKRLLFTSIWVWVSVYGGCKRDLLELESQEAMSFQTWVLGNELTSSTEQQVLLTTELPVKPVDIHNS